MNATYRFGVYLFGDASGLAKAAKDGEDALKRMGTRSLAEYQKMAKARETLGVRSERELQREIQRTEAAYNRLARTGTLSWREQWRAAQKMREEVTRLTNEMGRLTARQKAVLGLKGVAALGAGAGVATAIAAPRVQQTLDYDMRIAHLANTAFNDKAVGDRRAGLREINAMIVDAVRTGGGTRDSAVTAAEALFGAGIFKPGEIRTILREAVKAGTATNTESSAFAQMAITANQTMGIQPGRMGALFSMGTFAGQQGGFEIKDMAKWLPQQMAAAKAVGMAGETGFAKLAALNQAAIVTAGTRDEAGNNVVNLLAKIGSLDTVRDFRKQGVDLPKQLAEGRMRGLDALDVVGNLLQGQLEKDKNYQAIQRQLKDARSDSERRAALESVGNIAQGTTIGKVFQDRQALMALYGFMQGRDRVGAITQGALGNTNAVDRNFELISSMAGFKVEQRRQEQEIALHSSLEGLMPTIGGVNDRLAELMRQYPGYTTAVAAATTALVALAGSAAALSVLGGSKAAAAGGSAALGAAAGAAGRLALGAGGVGVAGAAGYGAGTLLYKGLLEGNAGGNLVGRGVAQVLSFFGNKEASAALASEAAGAKAFEARGLGDRLSRTGGSTLPLLQQDLKGEILLRVTTAPGVSVETEARTSSPRIPFRTDTGRTNTSAGY